ncbi:DUF3575 domain-containing protein [Porphyromonadaceae bacterium OttesenSCG-928-L07]|nr:DUF3575 domain-containing protein [Porphyromonadaceae bacterium OttesenSCG-928-L07]MDL2251393.1 DUF3575 domain-containing protein [Odoribacter sp. OttesenSCG-928-J03]MDL2330622.1 DUF3575 domain-containing protein [Odoribacter sp. OttesenSCG-928-A06]
MLKFFTKNVLFFVLCATSFVSVSAQERNLKWSLSTNVLDVAMSGLNGKATVYLGSNHAISAGGSYAWWDYKWKRNWRFQHWAIMLDYDYYFKQDSSFIGHHIGASFQTGQYEYKRGDYAYRGHFSTAGLTYGYTWKLCTKWYLDAGVGLGYMYRFYHKFDLHNSKYRCIRHEAKHQFTPTNAYISIAYRF